MPRVRQVALLIESSRGFGRGLLRGVAQYAHEHPYWSTHFRPHGLGEPPLAWISKWRGDGILARIEDERMAEAVLRPGAPVVELRGTLTGRLKMPVVRINDRTIAEMAGQHLLDRGFRCFGHCGYRVGYHPGLDLRAEAFGEFIRNAGYPCEFLQVYEPYLGRGQRMNWERQQARIAAWIGRLPKPVAIMAANDDRALEVLEACRRIGAVVPDEVAVIGVDNDECITGLSIPPLTSVDANPGRVGYQAAALLDSLMDGNKPPQGIVHVEPRGVVTRQSTDVLAIENSAVAEALRFIRENACRSIHVSDVLSHARTSRATLETELKRAIGRTIHQEIQRVRLERARELLATTNLPVKKIALDAGFRTVQYLTRVFTAATGTPPANFRRQSQV
jgi:LacI family transcriptional regulator